MVIRVSADTMTEIMALLAQDELVGLCRACGEIAYDVDSDAFGDECEMCGQRAVDGAEGLLLGISL